MKQELFFEGLRSEGLWNEGETPWFYGCAQPFGSPDPYGLLMGRSGWKPTVVGVVHDAAYVAFVTIGRTIQQRLYKTSVLRYVVRFDDGIEAVVRETELYENRDWLRKGPPKAATGA